ncbi:MAG: magnesium/cobalt transporter CorA [Thermoplasmata archaeon]
MGGEVMQRTYLYQEGKGVTQDHSLEKLAEYVGREGATFWIDLEAESDEAIAKLGKLFDFHPLTIEDCIHLNQRPKVDFFDRYLFMVIHGSAVDFIRGEMHTRELDLFIGENYVVTFHVEEMRSTEHIGEQIEKETPLLQRGADFLAYALLDKLVDNYNDSIDALDEEIDKIEERVLKRPDQELLNRITDLRRDLIYLQRIIRPQRETINLLAREESDFIKSQTRPYFRDIQDQLAWFNDILANHWEIITGSRDMYLSVLSNRMNEIMKTLTIIATIMLPLSLIAGIYGMNFKFMPELGWHFGYFGALSVMATVMVGLLVFFWKKGWLGR